MSLDKDKLVQKERREKWKIDWKFLCARLKEGTYHFHPESTDQKWVTMLTSLKKWVESRFHYREHKSGAVSTHLENRFVVAKGEKGTVGSLGLADVSEW